MTAIRYSQIRNCQGNDVDVASSDESPDTEEQQQQSINEKQYLETIDRTRLDFDFENLCPYHCQTTMSMHV